MNALYQLISLKQIRGDAVVRVVDVVVVHIAIVVHVTRVVRIRTV